MLLSVIERLALLNALPDKGDITTIRIVHDLRQTLAFSEEELSALNFRDTGDRLLWDEGLPDKDVELKPKAMAVVVQALKRLSSNNQLTEDHLAIYDRFMTDEE
jgi:hypothetical protein